ncbi:MAG: hypothetical protein H5T69_12575, partial [Chloroflexi bacterium]|nr:hypothetical protein [Chloroflexota bacterium]
TQPRGGIVYQTPQPGEVRRERRAPRTLTWQAILLGLVRWVVARLRDLITLLILGGLLIWLLPALFVQTTEEVRRRPWPCLGWGFLTWVAGFVAAGVVLGLILVLALFLGFVTLGGLAGAVLGIGLSGLGLAFTTFLLLVNYGSKLVVAMTVGRLLLEAIAPRSFARPDYAAIEEGNWWRLPTVPRETIGPLLLGVAIYVLLRGVPLLGWLVGLIVTFFGLGAIALRYADWRSALAKRRL